MASFEQHCQDCERFLGDRCENVNRWIDEFFKTLGPSHRRVRHHREGIEEARHNFGDLGALGAAVHILRDCRHIPNVADYDGGTVDALGLVKYWPASAYVKYPEKEFEELVSNELFGSIGRILWAFMTPDTLGPFLTGVSRLSPSEVQSLIDGWKNADAYRSSLPPIQSPSLPSINLNQAATDYLNSWPLLDRVKETFGNVEFAYVPFDQLVCPLIFIEGEYLNALRAELISTAQEDVLKFALPTGASTSAKGLVDPSRKMITFISTDKSVTVGPGQLTPGPGGAQVSFTVGPNLSIATASFVNDRLVLRNGIHRAFLLASLGVTDIPCFLVHEPVLPPFITTAYPAFSSAVLMQPRPPMLRDLLDDHLSIEIPMLRTRKVVRLTVEELILPID